MARVIADSVYGRTRDARHRPVLRLGRLRVARVLRQLHRAPSAVRRAAVHPARGAQRFDLPPTVNTAGLFSAWRPAQDRRVWTQLVTTTTLQSAVRS